MGFKERSREGRRTERKKEREGDHGRKKREKTDGGWRETEND